MVIERNGTIFTLTAGERLDAYNEQERMFLAGDVGEQLLAMLEDGEISQPVYDFCTRKDKGIIDTMVNEFFHQQNANVAFNDTLRDAVTTVLNMYDEEVANE